MLSLRSRMMRKPLSLLFSDLRIMVLYPSPEGKAMKPVKDYATENRFSIAANWMEFRPVKTQTYVVSFSGGRSSAVLLKYLLEMHHGTLPSNYIVLFANTGKEHAGTLDFVHQIETRWNVDIHWLEYDGLLGEKPEVPSDNAPIAQSDMRVNRVTYETASRNGEPWYKVIDTNPGYAPRRAARLCTYYMKVGSMWSYMAQQGRVPFTNLVGFRSDEASRLAATKAKCGKDPTRPWVEAPLVHIGISRDGVNAYWKDSRAELGFDLDIPIGAGNCDMCFLKGRRELARLAYANPGMIDWWIKADKYAQEIGATRPMLPNGGYETLMQEVEEYGDMESENHLALECSCTD